MDIENKMSDLNQLAKKLYLQGKYDDALVAAEQSHNLSQKNLARATQITPLTLISLPCCIR